MSSWGTSLSLAMLVVMVPFCFVYKVLLQLPQPLALSHRRWPVWVNLGLIAIVTTGATIFIRRAYYGANTPAENTAAFLIAALAYAFALVLVIRQFSGVYAEYIVTTGPTGLALRKTRYRNIQNVETVSQRSGETRLKIRVADGRALSMTLPTRHVRIFMEQLRKKLQDG